MLSLSTFQPQLAIPPLTSLWNAVRCSSNGVTVTGRRNQQATTELTIKTEEPVTAKEITESLQTSLHDIGLDRLSSQVTVEELNPLLAQRNLPKKTSDSFISSATFFENKNGFSQKDLRSQQHARLHLQSFKVTFPLLTGTLNSINREPVLYHQPARGFRSERVESAKGLVHSLRTKQDSTASKKIIQDDNLNEIIGQVDEKSKKAVLLAFARGYAARDGSSDNKQSKSRTLAKYASYGLLVAVLAFMFFNSSVSVGGGRLPYFRGEQYEINPQDIDVNFTDVIGMKEAKQELQDVVEYLKAPNKFKAMGAKLPSGVLLVGPPGMGKTLLARAVAGEAGVPYFHASGSEFDEIFVGTGAKKVRTLFEAAKAKAPCVIFIDEIDTVGAKRINSQFHPYANQTINMLLSEMDGFKQNEGIIVLGATNRRNTLDKALLRPGRFDVEVRVYPPDLEARKGILDHYLKDVLVGSDIDTEQVAKGTVGCTGADLKNIINQAALKAAMDGEPSVRMEHVEYAKDKILMGPAMKSMVQDEKALKCTAYHEAGHALVAWYTKDAKDLYKVTIVPRGMSLGHTAFAERKDQYSVTKSQLMAQMDVAMGGRIGEEILSGSDNVSSGPSHDFQAATSIATAMVKQYGMSEKVGMRSFNTNQEPENAFVSESGVSQATAEVIDDEIKRLIQDSYERAKAILKAHKNELHSLADALLKYETLDKEDLKVITQGKKVQRTLAAPPAKPKGNNPLPVDNSPGTPKKAPLMS